MAQIILPDDPDWKEPIKMGNAYKEALTPKLASQKRAEDFDKQREAEGTHFKYATSMIAHQPEPWVKTAQTTGVSNMMTQPMWFSPLHTPQNWQIASKRREIYQWCRFFYENEPKVAAAIDFYSRFPMNGFRLECSNRKILKFFEHKVVKRLKLNELFKQVSSEYFMMGDVFIHTDVQCPVCEGSAVDPDTGEMCNHPGGIFSKIIALNPDWMEVQRSVLAPDDPAIVMIPDEELKRIVFYKQPKYIYDRIPDSVKALVISNKPIPLSNRTISHLKHMPVPYGTYGTSLIRRLFTTLAYKTKIMTANWIVAERLILPVRVVKIGSDNRPASSADIADIQQQLASTANDPNLTIVTHHNFDYEWYGVSGKILQVTQELEHTGKEILDGFMLNQALLNGEMSGYQSAQVGVETLIRRIESWRHTLADWCEENIFKPIAEMQGFLDEEESAEIDEPCFIYPTIKWNDLNLKDKQPWFQTLMQLHDKQVVSTQTLLEEMELNYDQEVKRLRYEQAQVGPMGAMPPAGDQGGMGLGGGMGGGAAGGMPGAEMGAPGAGGMPGMEGGIAPGMPGGAGGGAAGIGTGPMAGSVKVMKKGKTKEAEDQEQMPMQSVMLTRVEQDLRKILEDISNASGIPLDRIRFQYPVENPQGGKHFALDFAIPHIKLAIEADGEVWHSSPEQLQDDKKRDHLLATRGWTILRFDDKTIEDAPQAVGSTIGSFMERLMKQGTKKASVEDNHKGAHLFSYVDGKIRNMNGNYDRYIESFTVYESEAIS